MKKLFFQRQRCLSCKSCELACARRDSPPRLKLKSNAREANLSLCSHCEEPLCVVSCVSGAMHIQGEGVVVSDEEKCVGCWMCVAVCPVGAVFPHPTLRKSWKCNLCLEGEDPACVRSCPTGALSYKEEPFGM